MLGGYRSGPVVPVSAARSGVLSVLVKTTQIAAMSRVTASQRVHCSRQLLRRVRHFDGQEALGGRLVLWAPAVQPLADAVLARRSWRCSSGGRCDVFAGGGDG